MADPKKLSATKITTYKGCSMAYFLKHEKHEKVPINVRLHFGKEVHYMLEQFYKKKFKSADSFANYFKYRWYSSIAGDFLKGKQKENLKVREIQTSPNFVLRVGSHIDLGTEEFEIATFFSYMNLGVDILRRFYDKHKNLNRPFVTEKSFGVRKDELILINGHSVRGVFDRIDEWDGKWYIQDYKTDKNSPERDSFVLHRNLQFTLYSMAFREIFGVDEEAILYYHLRSGRRYESHRSEKDYDYMRRLLDEVAEGIRSNRFVPFYGFHCNFCDMKVACEKYCIDYHGGPRIDLEGRIKSAKEFHEIAYNKEVPNDWDTNEKVKVVAPDWMAEQSDER